MVLLASKRRGYEGHAASRASALASLKGGCLYPCSPLAGARAQQHQPCRQGPPLKGWTPIIITRGSRQKSSLMAQLVRSAPHALTARGTCWAVGFRFTAFVGQPGSKGHKQGKRYNRDSFSHGWPGLLFAGNTVSRNQEQVKEKVVEKQGG